MKEARHERHAADRCSTPVALPLASRLLAEPELDFNRPSFRREQALHQ